MSSPPQIVRGFVEATPGVARVVIAVSGGLDSTVLLHAAVAAGLPHPLLAIHVNHQLSAKADTWQAHFEHLCRQLRVEGICERVVVTAAGEGLEQAARTARYKAIERHLRPQDLVLMGHHQLDQVETCLLRLARGAGPTGLAAMAPRRVWGAAQLGRPFLPLTRDRLLAYAHEAHLSWVEDDSNGSVDFDRNYLRLEVLPLFARRWPSFAQRVTEAAELLHGSDALLNEYAAQDLLECAPRVERVGESLLLEPLRGWSSARRNLVVRRWLASQGYRMPARKPLEEVGSLLLAAREQNPLLHLGDCELRRFRARLYCLPAAWNRAVFAPGAHTLCAGQPILLPDGARLLPQQQAVGFAPGRYELVPRSVCNLKRAHPAGRGHSQTLKNLLQEYALEPWLRDRLPLVMAGGELVAAGDLWVERSFVKEGPEAIFLQWRPTENLRFPPDGMQTAAKSD